VVVMLAYAVVLLQPPVVLFVGFFVYAISGPVLTLVRRRKRLASRRRGREAQRSPEGRDGP